MTETKTVEGVKAERRKWLAELLLDRIQFHIWTDARLDEVVEVIEALNEGSSFDDEVGALVQVPRWVSDGEAQEVIDAAFARHRLASQSLSTDEEIRRLRGVLEWIAIGDTQVFDDDLERMVEVSACAEEMQEVARLALTGTEPRSGDTR